MTPGVISFSCSSCGVHLTVPEAMAGISGPCPRCSATIQAPAHAPGELPATSAVPKAPTPLPVPGADPTPTPELSTPPSFPVKEHPPTIIPKPRATPGRQITKGIAARHSTNDALRRRRTTTPSSRSSRPTRNDPGLGRFILPLLFVITGATVVYGLCYYYLPSGPGDRLRHGSSRPPGSPPAVQPIYPETKAPEDAPTPSKNDDPDRIIADAPPISVDGADAIEAEKVLDLFLSARSLDERINLIDLPLPNEQLENTILAQPMPEVFGVTPQTPSFDAMEKLINFPFRVQFQGGEGSVADYTILVRKRADLDPKIVVNPFLDLVGGRLSRFAATPTDGAHTFHAIIEAMPRCFEENIPNPDKKFTYKLSACDVGRATARAYASRYSSLAEQVFTPDSRIRWGKRIRATITLQWNTTEDPTQPYIELIEIKGLDWNQQ